MNKKYRIRLIFICIVWLGVGCQNTAADSSTPAQTSTPDSPVITKTISDEIIPSPTPFTCTPLPEGMTLDLNPVSSTLVEIVAQGLQPGEEITVVFTAKSPGHGKMIEDRGILIGSDGRYSSQEILNPIPRSDENHWEVSVIHSRGVACAEVTLLSN
jgi:hypothetical protein